MGLSPPIMSDIFSLSENSSYNLRCGVTVNRRNIRTSKFGFETVSTIGAILWNDLTAELKNAVSLKKFNKRLNFRAQMIVPVKYAKIHKKFRIHITSKTKKK